jgi:hypothetical protein
VNGAIGSSTSLNSRLALKGLSVTTICALPMRIGGAAPAAESNTGSVFSSSTAFRPEPGEHLAGVEAAVLRQGADELRAHGVGGFGEVADGGAGLRADPVRQCQQAAALGVVGGGVAEQDGLALAAQQRRCDGLCGVVRLVPCGASGAAAPLVLPMAAATRPALRPIGRLRTMVDCATAWPSRGRPSVRGDHRQRGALAHGLADALREQRVFLAQVRADDQRALHVRERGDRGAEPTHAFERREFGVAQAVVDVVAAQFTRSMAARNSSSSVLCGLTSVPMLCAPWSALICFRPLATYSSAVCQSTCCHWPPCLSMGCVRRSGR